MKRAVLFDLDGTLLDTLDDLADSMNAALERTGFPSHPVSSYRYFVGDGVDVLVRRVLPSSALLSMTVYDLDAGSVSTRRLNPARTTHGSPRWARALRTPAPLMGTWRVDSLPRGRAASTARSSS